MRVAASDVRRARTHTHAEALGRQVSAPAKPIPDPQSSSDDEGDAAAAPRDDSKPKVRHHGFRPRAEGESSDLEESSSSTDEEELRRRAARAARAKKVSERARRMCAGPPRD